MGVFNSSGEHVPGNATTDGLHAPSMSIVDVSNLVKQAWSVDPGPGKLPCDGRPPFPTSATLESRLLVVCRTIRPRDCTKTRVKFPRDHEDDDGEQELRLLVSPQTACQLLTCIPMPMPIRVIVLFVGPQARILFITLVQAGSVLLGPLDCPSVLSGANFFCNMAT